jgi:hypothetical protein
MLRGSPAAAADSLLLTYVGTIKVILAMSTQSFAIKLFNMVQAAPIAHLDRLRAGTQATIIQVIVGDVT